MDNFPLDGFAFSGTAAVTATPFTVSPDMSSNDGDSENVSVPSVELGGGPDVRKTYVAPAQNASEGP